MQRRRLSEAWTDDSQTFDYLPCDTVLSVSTERAIANPEVARRFRSPNRGLLATDWTVSGNIGAETTMCVTRTMTAALLMASGVFAQTPTNPLPPPIEAVDGLLEVNFVEFATLPDIDGETARMMLLIDEPGTGRLFVSDMRGPLYTVTYDGQTVTQYLDVNAERWGVGVQSPRRGLGVQSFAFHPQFTQRGTPGFGKLYTWTDTSNTAPEPDFAPGGGDNTHDIVLLEWTAGAPGATTYDGGPPRELLRIEQPFRNHNGGHMDFNPLAAPSDPDFGLLYVGMADGGSGGDPLNNAQNLGSAFGKILRLDPLGSNSANGQYGIPDDNPFANDGDPTTLGEIYAYGVRNPHRFGWDSKNGNLFVGDIGQNLVEELSLVTAGANLGWNDWEGSFRFISREEVSLVDQRGDATVTFPLAEYGHVDPLLTPRSAMTGGIVYRRGDIEQLANLVLFGELVSGEIFYIPADDLPDGGQEAIRRILLNDNGESKTFMQLIHEKNAEHGKPPTPRADLRFGTGPDGRVFLLNKHDGIIRMLVPDDDIP